MAGAFAYDLYKNRGQMTAGNTLIVAVGFVAVVHRRAGSWSRRLLGYVTRHGFTLFAWWRVIVGTLGLLGLLLAVLNGRGRITPPPPESPA